MKKIKEEIWENVVWQEVMDKLYRIACGDDMNTPVSYLAGELRYLASQLEMSLPTKLTKKIK